MMTVFEVCFYVGTILTILFFILGHISDFINFDGVDVDVDVDMDLDVDGIDLEMDGVDVDGVDMDTDGLDVDVGSGSGLGFLLGLFKPNLIILFCTLFGGFGLIFLNSGLGERLATVIAAGIGFTGAYILNRFLIKLLKRESTTAASQNDLIGHLGKAALDMAEERVGCIIYIVNGNTFQSPAKSFEKTPIKKGDDIIIVDIKENLFYVKKF